MAFDPTLPADHSPDSSAEMRGQLNALKALIDAQAAQITTFQNQMSALPTLFPSRVDGVDPLAQATNDPPTQEDVQVIANTVDALINGLRGI